MLRYSLYIMLAIVLIMVIALRASEDFSNNEEKTSTIDTWFKTTPKRTYEMFKTLSPDLTIIDYANASRRHGQ